MSSAPPRPPLPARLEVRLRRLAGLVVALVVLAPAAAQAVPIEDFAAYQPQTRCNPDPKPGTLALSRWLLKKYPGTGSSGISRGCGASGVSEHKEGRAFDWRVSASSARDRAYVKDFLDTILAADQEGNRAALARRMGIMYVIWNDHIYASYRGFAKRSYAHSGCRSRRSCSPTLRHRDHVHISLSRAGGRGETSWYHRKDKDWVSPIPEPPAPAPTTPTPPPSSPTPPTPPAPPTVPDPPVVGPPVQGELRFSKDKRYARIAVPLDGSTHESRWKLRQGKTYKLTVAGVVGYGAPDRVGDAACVWSSTTRSWLGAGSGVKVDGKLLFGSACAADHVYSTTYVPRRSKPLRVKLAAATAAVSGRLVLTVSRRSTDVTEALPTYPALTPAPTLGPSVRGTGLLTETLQVPAAAAGPVSTTQEVQAGARYRMTVSGVAELGGGVQTDGQCLGIDGQWHQSASLDRRYPGDDHGNLYVNGYAFAGSPPTDCSTHSHVMEFTAAESRRLQLAVWDPFGPAGNSGELTVTVQRLTAIPEPRQVRGERPSRSPAWTQKRDEITVDVASAAGTVSTMRLRKGERVTVSVTGTYTSGAATADAACVATTAGWLPRDPALALAQDPLELWVDGTLRSWGGCSDSHRYSTSYVVDKSGPLRLAVMDLDHRDNAGALQVTLVRGR